MKEWYQCKLGCWHKDSIDKIKWAIIHTSEKSSEILVYDRKILRILNDDIIVKKNHFEIAKKIADKYLK